MAVNIGTLERQRQGRIRRVWFQRPHLVICRYLDDGEFAPPTHLSANLSFCVFGRSVTISGRREPREQVTR
jgi:hypothetical protein